MDAIITIDEDQRIILFNPAAEQMFGVSRDDAMGEPISRFIPQRFRPGHDEHIRRFRKTGVTGRRMGALGAISGLRADSSEFPIEASISQVDIQGERLATVILRDITERLANEEARLLLAREVDHRAKNALAVVQALVSLTIAPTKDAFVAAVRGRVAALGRAHSLLAQNRWIGGDLSKIVTDEASAYCRPGQIRVHGPSVCLLPNAVQPVSLLIHELATNAVKYGAFSSPTGRVDVKWRFSEDHALDILWQESGLSETVSMPVSQGFGSTLIDTVARQLGGEVSTEWEALGVRVHAHLPHSSYRGDSESHVIGNENGSREEENKRKFNILVVEDELLVAMELCSALEGCGWKVLGPATSVDGAFRLISKADQISAAVLDINLNGEMVYPVADLLETRGVPYLFCTGYETAGAEGNYHNKPILRKPTNLDSLVTEVRRLVDRPEAPDGRRAA